MKLALAALIGAGLRGVNAYALTLAAEPHAALRVAFQTAHGLRDDQWETRRDIQGSI